MQKLIYKKDVDMRLVGKRTMGRIWMDISSVNMRFMDNGFVDSPFVEKEINGHEKHGRHVNRMLQERQHRLNLDHLISVILANGSILSI